MRHEFSSHSKRSTALATLVAACLLTAASGRAQSTNLTGIVAVAAGLEHTCAVTNSGGVKCWGKNNVGQLGDGTTADHRRPLDVSGLTSGVVALTAGFYHTCAVTSGGAVKCWGRNDEGQLGDGTMIQRLTPTGVNTLTSGVAALAGGGGYTCALTSGGGVKCWGGNGTGGLGDGTTTQRSTPVDVSGLTSGVAAVTAGGGHTCALTTAGGLKCWGNNGQGQIGDGTRTHRLTQVDVSGLSSGVVAVNAKSAHTCALTSGGGVKCWGNGGNGELGDGTTTLRVLPVDVSGLTSGVASVAAGYGHTCAVVSGGLKCWGGNFNGQLGDGTTTQRLTPVDVSGLAGGVATVAVGGFHTCALTSGGGVKCWGSNANGQVGDGTITQRLTPVDVLLPAVPDAPTAVRATAGIGQIGVFWTAAADNGSPITGYQVQVATSVGGPYANATGCATNSTTPACTATGFTDGTSYFFKVAGINGVGTGAYSSASSGVTLVPPLAGMAAVSAGIYHTCGVTSGGGVKCWGFNANGQLGDGTTTQRFSPVDVSGLTNGAAAVASGTFHSCALTSGGGVKCWGNNFDGQLGDGTTTQRLTSVNVSGLTSGVVAVGARRRHSCAVTSDGGAKCWGYNGNGELGDGTTTQRLTPVFVSGLTSGTAAVAPGIFHSCALTSAGGVKCWGFNGNGELGDGTQTQRLTPVDVSGLTSGVAAVATLSGHTCALTTGGGVKCWGHNGNGDLGDGTTTRRLTPVDVNGLTSGVVAVTAGESHTCALTSGGGVKCWGLNSDGQLGDGTTTQRLTPVDVSGLSSGVVAVTAGDSNTCALRSGGGVKCWGYNGNGELGDGTATNRLTPVDVAGSTTVPDAPTGVMGTAGHAEVAVSWTAPASNGSAIVGYQVQVATSVGGTYANATGCATNSTAPSCTATGLTNGTPYFFKVAAINSVGTGVASSPSAAVTPGIAPTVTAIAPASGSTGGGTIVTITGTSFIVGGTSVTIGGNAATSVSVLSSTSLTARTPSGSAGGATVTANTAYGTGSLVSGFTYFVSLFTDDPLQAGVTPIKPVHVTELRTRIDAQRARFNLTAFAWTDASPAAGSTGVKAIHIAELRTALQQAYSAGGFATPIYTDATLTAGTTTIKVLHFQELRDAVLALEAK